MSEKKGANLVYVVQGQTLQDGRYCFTKIFIKRVSHLSQITHHTTKDVVDEISRFLIYAFIKALSTEKIFVWSSNFLKSTQPS